MSNCHLESGNTVCPGDPEDEVNIMDPSTWFNLGLNTGGIVLMLKVMLGLLAVFLVLGVFLKK